MKRLIYLLVLLLPVLLNAQHSLSVTVKDKEEGAPVYGATVNIADTNIVATTDSFGVATLNGIPDGEQTVVVSYIGYFKRKLKLTFPLKAQGNIEVKLETQAEEMEEVVITSTRNYRKYDDLPSRVDVVVEEEVEERSHDKPSAVSHVVREQAGVQVQRTSATAGTMSIRLMGLRGRYVQVLKDGFPVFGGFGNVLGVTQIPPLDLRQVEIIKGPSSTLYGGDAIAGVINLISKEPAERPVYDLMANGESAKAVDAGLFAAQKFKWFAFTLTGMYRYQTAKDWNGDNFSETPWLQRYYTAPQLFFELSPKAKLNIGASYTHEGRTGGALPYIQGKADSVYSYYEKNQTGHLTTNFKFVYDFGDKGKLTLKNSVNYFMRDLRIPAYFFGGTQLGTASEFNYHFARKKHDIVIGVDFRTDKFGEKDDSSRIKRNYDFYTPGFFAQYMLFLSPKTILEGGIRLDYNNKYKFYALPHLAVRQKWNDVFTNRVNFGMGYKLPTVFLEESEQARFVNVLSIADSIKPELSMGGTVDLLIKTPNINGFTATVNLMYFITHIFRPMLPVTSTIENCTGDCDQLEYTKIKGFQQSLGLETSLKLAYRGAGVQLGYVLTDNHLMKNGVRSIAPLTSKHIVSILAGYEGKIFGAGIDAYYYSPVKLTNGKVGQQVWEVGVNVQVSLKYILLFANLENIVDIRQTSYGPIVQLNSNFSRPQFSEIYAPLEGRLFNAGFKLRLGAFSKKHKGGADGVERLRGKDDD